MADDPQEKLSDRSGQGRSSASRPHDPASFEPAYLRIANALSDQIAAGAYRSGDQLPTEPQLRAKFGVSPVTVRRAISLLLDRGLVSTTKGKGTFVRSTEMGKAVFYLQDLADLWAEGGSTEVRLLEASIVWADDQVAAKLGLQPDALVVLLRRIIERDGIPLVYQIEYVTYDEHRPLVEAQLQVTSLEGLLRSPQSEGIGGGQLSIEAVALEPEAASALRLPLESPALNLESLFVDYDGRPISWGRFFCRADQFRMTTQVGLVPRNREG